MTQAEEFLDTARALVAAARPVIRTHYRMPIPVDFKADSSPVTAADTGAETAMREVIAVRHPDHGVIGEEFPPTNPDADFVWVFDPIDGTKSFIAGIPLFATLIALTYKGRPILGAVDQAILDETWLGMDGMDSTLNDRPIRTRDSGGLDRSILFTSGIDYWRPAHRPVLDRLMDKTGITRMGADAYGFMMVALGMADIAIEAEVKPHDILALAPIVAGAGGVMTDWQGTPVDLHADGFVIAAGSAPVHAAALEEIAAA